VFFGKGRSILSPFRKNYQRVWQGTGEIRGENSIVTEKEVAQLGNLRDGIESGRERFLQGGKLSTKKRDGEGKKKRGIVKAERRMQVRSEGRSERGCRETA